MYKNLQLSLSFVFYLSAILVLYFFWFFSQSSAYSPSIESEASNIYENNHGIDAETDLNFSENFVTAQNYNDQNYPSNFSEKKVNANILLTHLQFNENSNINAILRMDIKDKFHTYWRNPGDIGLPLKIEFSHNITINQILYPEPEKFILGEYTDYGHHGIIYFSFPLIFSQIDELKNEATETINAKISWLVCKDICILEEENFQIPLRYSENEKLNPVYRNYENDFLKQEKNINRDEKIVSSFIKDKYQYLKIDLSDLEFINSRNDQLKEINLFPVTQNIIDNSAKVIWEFNEKYIYAKVKLNKNNEDRLLEKFLLRLDKSQFFKVKEETFIIDNIFNNKNNSYSIEAFLLMLLLSILGGFILNLMPCIFPVLFLKVKNIIDHDDKKNEKADALIYLLTTLTLFQFFAFVINILISKNGNYLVGSHLQSPIFIYVLLSIFVLLTLRYINYFAFQTFSPINIKLPNFVKKLGTNRYIEIFQSSLLMIIVATPCIGPLLSIPLVFAFSENNLNLNIIFLFISIGFASPLFLLMYFRSRLTAILKFVPKPGEWLLHIHKIMLFPLLITILWLFWVLVKLTSVEKFFYVGMGIIAIIFAIYILNIKASKKFNIFIRNFFFLLVFAFWMYVAITLIKNDKIEHLTYSEELITNLQQEEKSYFVNVTASWCITCQFNEQRLFNKKEFQTYLTKNEIIYIKADFTTKSEEIKNYLMNFNAAGVPFYIFYYAPNDEYVILPQIPTFNDFKKVIDENK